MKKDITELYVFIDDFCAIAKEKLAKYMIEETNNTRSTRIGRMSISEIITIILLYHQSPCKNFKYFYLFYLPLYKDEFPGLISYNRFIELKTRSIHYLIMLLSWLMELSKKTGINYVDSTSVNVCHAKRISRNKVFNGVATIGKTTKGWFYGFKLYIVINHLGEIQGVKMSQGNVDDRKPVPELVKKLKGLLLADKGYISSNLFAELYDKGLKLVTGIRKGMKKSLISFHEKLLLRKRSIIETVFDYLKNKLELEHSRHRSINNFIVHILPHSYLLLP
jgi:hypothetical protein